MDRSLLPTRYSLAQGVVCVNCESVGATDAANDTTRPNGGTVRAGRSKRRGVDGGARAARLD